MRLVGAATERTRPDAVDAVIDSKNGSAEDWTLTAPTAITSVASSAVTVRVVGAAVLRRRPEAVAAVTARLAGDEVLPIRPAVVEAVSETLNWSATETIALPTGGVGVAKNSPDRMTPAGPSSHTSEAPVIP